MRINKLGLWGVMLLLFIMAAAHDSYGSSAFKPPESPKERYVRQLVDNTIGTDSNRMVPHYRGMWSVGDVWIVHLNADNHASTKMIRGMVLLGSSDIFARIFNERKDVNRLSIHWYYPLPVGQEGLRRDTPIIKITMSRKTAGEVNWQNIPIWDCSSQADSYFEFPGFTN